MELQPARVFEFVETPLDHVAQGVNSAIRGHLDEMTALCRDHGEATALLHVFANKIGFATLVRQQHFQCCAFRIYHGLIALEVGDKTGPFLIAHHSTDHCSFSQRYPESAYCRFGNPVCQQDLDDQLFSGQTTSEIVAGNLSRLIDAHLATSPDGEYNQKI